MKRKRIGTSDVTSSPLILGTHAIGGGEAWGNSDRDEAIHNVKRAGELGINTIDLAPMYGYGECERLVGKAVKGNRENFVLITKCGLQLTPEGSLHGVTDGRNIYRNLSPKAIRKQLEQSLRNLDTDYVDIYLTHWQSKPCDGIPVADTMGELCRLKEEGKSVLDRMFGNSLTNFVAALYDGEDMDEEEIKSLQSFIDSQTEEKK